MKIIIGFSKPKSFKIFSWAIIKGYGTPYSHVYVKFYSAKFDRELYYQASGLSVNFMGSDHFNNHNMVVKEFELSISEESGVAMIQYAIDTAGAPYGISQIFWMAYVRLGEILGKKWSSPKNDGEHTFVCSELASIVLEKFVGIKLPSIPDDMTPLAVYSLLSQAASAPDCGTSGQNT